MIASSSSGNTQDLNDENHAWIARIDAPDDLYIRQGKYRGPSVDVWFFLLLNFWFN